MHDQAEIADLRSRLAAAHRKLEEQAAEQERCRESLIRILSGVEVNATVRYRSVPEMLAYSVMRELRAARADVKQLCEIIDHANPGAWANGNTHPDAGGTDEGETCMARVYGPLRAKYNCD